MNNADLGCVFLCSELGLLPRVHGSMVGVVESFSRPTRRCEYAIVIVCASSTETINNTNDTCAVCRRWRKRTGVPNNLPRARRISRTGKGEQLQCRSFIGAIFFRTYLDRMCPERFPLQYRYIGTPPPPPTRVEISGGERKS